MSKIDASSTLKHRLTKGELRELFTVNVLNSFLTSQFSIGSGIIINQKEEQSNQTDIIIYDNRILPPFIKEQHIGVYPAECVIGTIEVKSILDINAVSKAAEASKVLNERVYNHSSSIYHDYHTLRPLSTVIGFYGKGANFLRDQENGNQWLNENVKYIFGICLIGNFSWLNLREKGWRLSLKRGAFEETKRFLAVYLDNLRSRAEARLKYIGQFEHYDWLSIYTRDQKLFTDDVPPQ